MTGRVISLEERRKDRVFPRQLFYCNDCGCRTFKIYRSDGETHVECANCERDIAFEDILNG